MCNVPANLYDNGDCCLASIVEHYCHNTEMKDISGDCVCHEDNTRHPGLEGKGVFSKPFLQCKCVQDSPMEHGVNLQLFWVRFVNVIGTPHNLIVRKHYSMEIQESLQLFYY